GMVNAKNAVDLILADGGIGQRIKQGALDQGGTFEVPLTLASGKDLRVVLGWADPEVIIFPSDGLAAATLVNDLDVKVITPAGDTVLPYVLDKADPTAAATRGVNTVDNTEMLEIAGAAAGTYRIVVTGSRITAQAPQQFVLVANAGMGAGPPPCVDEPNVSEAAATILGRNSNVTARACDAADVDFFSFTANEPGTVSVTVTATDTALRATLTSSATAPVTVDVPAGSSRTLTVPFSGTTPTKFFVRIEPVGTIGENAAYTISADYPFNPGPRRRVVGR
ncbi:MAG TPA: PPC domain-containing protein, partial [Thermoanaerobaculia bacterium]|nr:PPC domain-containing protein [Thermoanaerobaculia bacterium]